MEFLRISSSCDIKVIPTTVYDTREVPPTPRDWPERRLAVAALLVRLPRRAGLNELAVRQAFFANSGCGHADMRPPKGNDVSPIVFHYLTSKLIYGTSQRLDVTRYQETTKRTIIESF